MTESHRGPFESVSKLLLYPDADYRPNLARCSVAIGELAAGLEAPSNGEIESVREARRRIDRFSERIRGMTVEELQELFTQTFDLNPVCSLEVGWHLYGEEYSRGAFLVSMRGLLRKHGVEESGELPDHLTNLLPLLDRMEPHERRYFVEKYLAPAMAKMLAAFEAKDGPYAEVMPALQCLMDTIKEAVPEEVSHG